jgi:hypothetical protein
MPCRFAASVATRCQGEMSTGSGRLIAVTERSTRIATPPATLRPKIVSCPGLDALGCPRAMYHTTVGVCPRCRPRAPRLRRSRRRREPVVSSLVAPTATVRQGKIVRVSAKRRSKALRKLDRLSRPEPPAIRQGDQACRSAGHPRSTAKRLSRWSEPPPRARPSRRSPAVHASRLQSGGGRARTRTFSAGGSVLSSPRRCVSRWRRSRTSATSGRSMSMSSWRKNLRNWPQLGASAATTSVGPWARRTSSRAFPGRPRRPLQHRGERLRRASTRSPAGKGRPFHRTRQSARVHRPAQVVLQSRPTAGRSSHLRSESQDPEMCAARALSASSHRTHG